MIPIFLRAMAAARLATLVVLAGASAQATSGAAPAAPPRIARPALPVRLDPAAADSVRRAVEKDRADTEQWLRSDSTSYLATVQRRDFGDKTALTVGREPGNDVRIDDPTIEPHHLRVTVAGDSFHVEALDPAARFATQGGATRDNQRRAVRVGWFDFMVGKTPCRLEATRLLEPGVGESDFGVFFRDATSGKESYGLGRYVDAKPLDSGRYVLDFNSAYNPACAISEHYNCPIPPRANRLKVAIRAGEMDSHYH